MFLVQFTASVEKKRQTNFLQIFTLLSSLIPDATHQQELRVSHIENENSDGSALTAVNVNWPQL